MTMLQEILTLVLEISLLNICKLRSQILFNVLKSKNLLWPQLQLINVKRPDQGPEEIAYPHFNPKNNINLAFQWLELKNREILLFLNSEDFMIEEISPSKSTIPVSETKFYGKFHVKNQIIITTYPFSLTVSENNSTLTDF